MAGVKEKDITILKTTKMRTFYFVTHVITFMIQVKYQQTVDFKQHVIKVKLTRYNFSHYYESLFPKNVTQYIQFVPKF